MTDLEKLANFTEQDIINAADDRWSRISKHCHRQNQTPKLYLVGGQPGAGKSTTISKIEDYMQGNCVVINLDDYRALHPNAREIYEKGAKGSDDYSAYTNPFMREVGEKLIDKAIENGYNVILERTLSLTDTVSKQLDKFNKNGYELNLYVVTCNKNHSMSSVEQRYLQQKVDFEKDKEFQEPPRKISKEFQKECYENLGKSTQTLAQKYDFKDIEIIYRSLQYKQHCVYDKNDKTKLHNEEKIEKLISRIVNGKNKAITNEELNSISKETDKAVRNIFKQKEENSRENKKESNKEIL